MLACDPACGCTLACSAPKSCFARSRARFFDHVGELAAAVVALAGISLGILVGEHRAHGFEHGFADKVLGSDQLQPFVLAPSFVVDGRGHLRIGFVQGTVHAVEFFMIVFSSDFVASDLERFRLQLF